LQKDKSRAVPHAASPTSTARLLSEHSDIYAVVLSEHRDIYAVALKQKSPSLDNAGPGIGKIRMPEQTVEEDGNDERL